jgi:glycosyltransferase involved in cell wall biosynthesis
MISIIVPTCQRAGMFEKMLFSIYDTTREDEREIIAVIDGDYESAKIAALMGCNVIDFSKEKRGALFCWNHGLQLSSGDMICPSGDDQIFHDGWLDYALESHTGQLGGYGVVGMNDLAYNGNTQLATMFIFDRQFCKDHLGGVIAPPVYKYYCVDSEINAKAKSLDKFYWDERAVVEHLHSAHGKRPVDAHDQERIDNHYAEIDNALFEQRKAQGFPIMWEPVI